MKILKREFKLWYPKHRGPIEPDLTTLLMGEARVLLTTWEALKDRDVITRRLKRLDKLYGEGAEQRVRDYMHKVKREERTE